MNLAWKQEDGLAILTEALFGRYQRTTKKAAAYGLRRMNGRMRKLAVEVLERGLKHQDRTTKAACVKSLALLNGTPLPPPRPKTGAPRRGPFRMRHPSAGQNANS